MQLAFYGLVAMCLFIDQPSQRHHPPQPSTRLREKLKRHHTHRGSEWVCVSQGERGLGWGGEFGGKCLNFWIIGSHTHTHTRLRLPICPAAGSASPPMHACNCARVHPGGLAIVLRSQRHSKRQHLLQLSKKPDAAQRRQPMLQPGTVRPAELRLQQRCRADTD